ncbi:hypothetical protein GF325_10645 [Candidatus Bathyarchaeota archaeon]|nr:hypothetical protein [Candidatus Bathyarchaeota archaeon]
MIEKMILSAVKKAPTREVATRLARNTLSNHGFTTFDQEEFDVLGVKSSGIRVIIKFWIKPSKKPVPKFYIKKFDKSIQDFVIRNDLQGDVHAFIIANTPLDTDAYRYYKEFARFSMKLIFTANDIKAQLKHMKEENHPGVEKFEQKALVEFISA